VFLTSDHADHAHGIDDLRRVFSHATGKPCLSCSRAAWSMLRRRFDYVFLKVRRYPATCTATDMTAPVIVGDMTSTISPTARQHQIDRLSHRSADGRWPIPPMWLDSRADGVGQA
jgi:phosphoribosyl 1,2-cyclic phosphate phosphodiesterase